MVTRLFLSVAVLLLGVFALSCGSDSDSGSPAARATSTPRAIPSGPAATVLPRSAPPGSQITISGTGWPSNAPITVTGKTDVGQTAKAYATVNAGSDGRFVATFLLEKTAGGDDLRVGFFEILVKSGSTEVSVPFQVETRRPVGPGSGSGG